MKYQRFEDLPVWQTAITFAVRVFELTTTGCVSRFSGFKNQFERCAVSISNNIAEGFERGTHEELLTFLYIAKGSTGEARSMLYLLDRLLDEGDYRDEIDELHALGLSITRQMNAWLESLKKTKAVGPRHKTAEGRAAAERARRQGEYLTFLKQVQDGTIHPASQVGDEGPPPL